MIDCKKIKNDICEKLKNHTAAGVMNNISTKRMCYRGYDKEALENKRIFTKELLDSHDNEIHYGLCVILILIEIVLINLMTNTICEIIKFDIYNTNEYMTNIINQIGGVEKSIQLTLAIYIPLVIAIAIILVVKIIVYAQSMKILSRELSIIDLELRYK